jgi:hypothetical protein
MSFINLHLKFELPEEQPILVYDVEEDDEFNQHQTITTIISKIIVAILSTRLEEEDY